jgi:hypothetical protein
MQTNSKLHSKEYFQQAFGTRPRRQASSDESVHQYAEEQRIAADKGIVLNANWKKINRNTTVAFSAVFL